MYRRQMDDLCHTLFEIPMLFKVVQVPALFRITKPKQELQNVFT